jgi:hypothetical protein
MALVQDGYKSKMALTSAIFKELTAGKNLA